MRQKRNKAAMTIQRGCHRWLWKPITTDGQMGIHMRLLLKQGQEDGLVSTC